MNTEENKEFTASEEAVETVETEVLEETIETTEAESKQENNLSELLDDLAQDDASYLEQTEVATKKPINKLVVGIIVGAVIIAAAVVAGLFIWSNPSRSGNVGNTTGNITNYGIAAKQGGDTYYTSIEANDTSSDSTTSSSDTTEATTGFKYSINVNNGKEDKKISDDVGFFLNACGNYIYYINGNDGYIYKVKKDGSNKVQLSNAKAVNLTVKGSYVYYLNAEDMAVYSMKTDGTKLTKLSPDGLEVFQFAFEGENLYYVNGADVFVYKTNYNFENPTLVVKKEVGSTFTIQDGNLYYSTINLEKSKVGNEEDVSSAINSNYMFDVYKVDLKTNEEKMISTVPLNNQVGFNVKDKYLYFTDNTTTNVSRLDLTTGGVEAFEQKGVYINIIDDLVYYMSATDGMIYKMNLDGTDARLA